MESIPENFQDLLTGTHFGHLVTLMEDGSPQTTVVWVDFDGSNVVFNTADGRLKAQNLDNDPRCAVSIHDESNPYRYLQVRGKVVEKTTEGADEHIDALAKRYMNVDSYPGRTPDEVRVIYRIAPEKVQARG